MRNTAEIRKLVSTIVGFRESGIVVSEDPGANSIALSWPTSMITSREKLKETKAKLEQMFPGWSFYYP